MQYVRIKKKRTIRTRANTLVKFLDQELAIIQTVDMHFSYDLIGYSSLEYPTLFTVFLIDMALRLKAASK